MTDKDDKGFKDTPSECVSLIGRDSFSSSPRLGNGSSSSSASCQTHAVGSEDAGCQAPQRHSKGTQMKGRADVTFGSESKVEEESGTATTTTGSSSSSSFLADLGAPLPQEVAKCLQRIVPIMEEELRGASRESKAFEYLEAWLSESSEGEDTESRVWCELAPDLSALMAIHPPHPERSLQCTGLSWSATGSTLVVSYGRTDIHGWCDEPGALCTWNIFRRDFDPSSSHTAVPDCILEHSSCLMCVSCHPDQPALVAAGSFNGEVVVWDLARAGDKLVASTIVDDCFHREPVKSVIWVRRSGREYLLASTSGDGKVLFWTLDNGLQYPLSGYSLLPPPSVGAAASSLLGKRASGSQRLIGGTSLSFPHEEGMVSSMMVGSEGGSVLRCFITLGLSQISQRTNGGGMAWSKEALDLFGRADSSVRDEIRLAAERDAASSSGTIDLADVYGAKVDARKLLSTPKSTYYEKHQGSVNSVDCSPFQRGMFLTSGSDGRLKLFSTMQRTPLQTLELPSPGEVPLCLRWSRSRPLVFAASSSHGAVTIYDLSHSDASPLAQLRPPQESGAGEGACFSLAFNPKQRRVLATGYENGCVRVWRLGWRIANPFAREEMALENLYQKTRGDEIDEDVG